MEEKVLDSKTEQAAPEKKRRLPKLPRGKKGRKFWILAVVVVLAVAIVGLFYASAQKGSNRGTGGYYQVVKAERRDLTVAVSGTATLQPADQYNATTLLSGEIVDAPFEEGDLVTKGTPLFTMDDSDARNNLSRANISVQQAQMALQQAKEAVNPVATLSGVVNQLYVHEGDSVNIGSPLVRIMASTDLTVDFLFPYTKASDFYIGQSATVFVGNFDAPITGAVTSVSDSTSITSTGSTGTSVRVKLTNPGTLSDSFTASALIGSLSSYGQATINMPGAVTVYATAAGTITNLKILSGSTVKNGAVLCTVESETARNQIKTASLSLQNAQLSASMAADTAEDYVVDAQIDGTVIEKNFKAGDKVEGMTSGSLAVIYDMRYLKMDIGVDELDIGKVAVGQSVEITADALPGQSFTGVVDKVSIRGNTVGGATSYPVTVIVENYGDLKPGMNVSAKIIGEFVEDALCIPLNAVKRGNTVEIPGDGALDATGTNVVNTGKIREQEITVGRNDEEYIEVTDGLAEGDSVLLFTKVTTMMDMMMGG